MDSAQTTECRAVTGGVEAVWTPDSFRGKRGTCGSGVG